jgi:hypothetical protein
VTLTGGAATLTTTPDGLITIAGQSRAAASVSAIVITGSALDDTLTLDLRAPLAIPVSFNGGAGTDHADRPGPGCDLERDRTRRRHGGGRRVQRGRKPHGRLRQQGHLRRERRGLGQRRRRRRARWLRHAGHRERRRCRRRDRHGPQSGILARGTNRLAYTGLEPVTVSGATTITINAPNSATVVLADSGTTSDKIFSVDFNAGGETHSMTAADTVAGVTLNLGSGTNAVTLNALDPGFKGTVTINGGPDGDTVTANARTGPGIYTFNGGGGTDKLIGPNSGIKWSITGEDAGSADGATLFHDVENITGGSGADDFTVVADGSISGQIDGGNGSDTLIGPDADNDWVLSGTDSGKLHDTDFIGIENLTGGNANDTFAVHASGSLTGRIDGGAAGTTASVDKLDYSSRGSPVSVNLSCPAVRGVTGFSRLTSIVGTGAATDTLTGPVALQDQTAWSVTGANSGTVEGTAFSAFANLTGQGSTNDAFIFTSGGSLSGTIDGGAGALDGFAVASGANLLAFQPSGTGPGTASVGGKTINYTRMDAYDPRGGTATNRVIIGTIFDRDLVLEADTAGNMKVSFTGLTFTSGGSSFSFANPSDSLTLRPARASTRSS